MYAFRENTREVISGNLFGHNYVVQEEIESGKKLTYQQWHQALGDPSIHYLKSNNYYEAPNLPKFPKTGNVKPASYPKALSTNLHHHVRLVVRPCSY